jgi:hypothetical protein
MSTGAIQASVEAFMDRHKSLLCDEVAAFLDQHPEETGELGAILCWDDDAGQAQVLVAPLAGVLRGWFAAGSSPDPATAAAVEAALRQPLPPPASGVRRLRTIVATPDGCFAVDVRGIERRDVPAPPATAPSRQQRRAAARAKVAAPPQPARSPDVIDGPDGGYLLNSRGVAKVMLLTARDVSAGGPGAQARCRGLLATWCGVPTYDRVEALANELGEDFIVDTVQAYLDAKGLHKLIGGGA